MSGPSPRRILATYPPPGTRPQQLRPGGDEEIAVAIQAAALANGRDPLIMAGILTMMLGLVTTASVLVGPEPHQQETAERSRPPARIVLPGAASCPLTGEDHLSRASTDYSAQPQG